MANSAISIRAPARGATETVQAETLQALEFQSALPRGERQFLRPFFPSHQTISIRAPARGATDGASGNAPSTGISIRAPARGATIQQAINADTVAGFQSALPRGERLIFQSLLFTQIRFQSALPRGERPSNSTTIPSNVNYFNPRSREGSDDGASGNAPSTGISIRAPARGAT